MFRPSFNNQNGGSSNGARRTTSFSGGVSERPRAGSRYPPHSSVEENTRWWQDFGSVPGGRKLWCRLVVVFTFVSLFGVGFIFLGAAFVHQAYVIYKTQHLSLPLTWCVVGIVSGSLMVLGSIVLGRFIISDKWRKNQQPTYPSMAPRPPARVRFTTNNNTPDSEADVQIDFPPPYEASNLPPIFIVTGRNVALTLPDSSANVMMPPSYTETVDSPPKYTEIDNITTRDSHPEGSSTQEGQEGASSDRSPARSQSNTSCNRIEVITVVSTREDPPPYDEGPSVFTTGRVARSASTPARQVEPLRNVAQNEDGR